MNQENGDIVSPSPAIRLDGVSYRANHTDIIKKVSGQFPTGNITALIGPSGAGKTTLLKLCNGLISPVQGGIYIEGKRIEEQSPLSVRRHVGIVLQSSPMIQGTVQANLALPLQLRGKTLSEEQAIATMERVGLPTSLLTRDARELSGGQKQKVSIARTLLNESKILLLDEITASLDPSSLQEIEDLIVKLKDTEKITIVWITHNLEQANRIGEYFWVMVDGQLREVGTKEEIYASEDEDVKRFVKGVLS
ncbi:phosphate ABC transporter ATP-binding protein [Sporosarcina sp. BI001-red]|uniref:ABC transporter ATP-binding protein n=1 Tax=Sporosarcina sp. BI001-red TaxID=2282866 RepID=UPI000E23D003|nr:phosphate ABC transporter ATP-binding protein [Sporosarcina sp. BI001-red]REB08029.1 phosphate ABC transporter ATP-binding protein [Sporosarcina sp. BI001-red]